MYSKAIFYNFQCSGRLISVLFAPLPSPLAITMQFVFFCLLSLIQGALIALSVARIFLILKVNKRLVLEVRVRNSPECPQPTDFNQLDHERHFKRVLCAIFTAITVYVLSVLGFTHSVETGTEINSKYKCIPLCCRNGFSALSYAHGHPKFKVPCDYLLPRHIQHTNSPLHDWIRDYCSFLSPFAAYFNQSLSNHNQHNSVFNFEHLNCSDNCCEHHLDHT